MTSIALQLPDTPQPHRFTRQQYYQMAELGFFDGRRVELIEGEIVEMAPQRDTHVAGTLLVQQALTRALPGFLVRTQMPLALGTASDPEPDVSVVTGSARQYVGTGHPATAVLVVEVSDTTLRFDRGRKAMIYARAGIADYWIVNLAQMRLEVMRQPEADPTDASIVRYASVTIVERDQQVSPLVQPSVRIAVADLQP